MTKIICLALVCAGWRCGIVCGAEVQVPAQYTTIQAAIDAASEGDRVVVAPGTYTGSGNRDLTFQGKRITVRSSDPNDHEIVAGTILDCGGSEAAMHRAFQFNSGEDEQSVVEGLTIRNGYHENGGAVWCWESNPTIRRCVLENNVATGIGGALACQNGAVVTVSDCTFSGNRALFEPGVISGVGGAIGVDGGSRINLARTILDGNRAEVWGGAVFVDLECQMNAVNCLFSGNYAVNYGGAVYAQLPDLALTNCTVTENRAGYYGGGVYIAEMAAASILTITGSILWNNETLGLGGEAVTGPQLRIANGSEYAPAIAWSAVAGGVYSGENQDVDLTGKDIVTGDPLFVGAGSWTDAGTPVDYSDDTWTGGNYRLRNGSPCVNAGDDSVVAAGVTTDLLGGARKQASGVDMGAYEMARVAGPDLTGTITANTLYGVMVPYDKGSVSIQVTNTGDAIAVGAVDIEVCLSQDAFWEASDPNLTVKPVVAKLKLAPGASKVYKAGVVIPPGLAPGSYYVMVRLNANNGLTEADGSLRSNAIVERVSLTQAARTRELVWKFGMVDAGRKPVNLTLLDSTGAKVTFTLTGGGVGRVMNAGLSQLVIQDTTVASKLTIKPTSKIAPLTLADVIIVGGLGAFNAKTTNLSGSIQSLGYVKAIALQHVTPRAGGNLITIAGQPASVKETVTLAFRQVSDLSVDAEAFVIGSIKADYWIDTDGLSDTIRAAAVGKISVKGDFDPVIEAQSLGAASVGGDWRGSMTLTGGDAAPRGLALGMAAVGGRMLNAEWTISGNVGAVSVASLENSRILVGVTEGLTSLSSQPGDFARQDNFASLSIRGGEGAVLVNSEVAVWSLGKLRLPDDADGSGIIQYALSGALSELPEGIEEWVVVSDPLGQGGNN